MFSPAESRFCLQLTDRGTRVSSASFSLRSTIVSLMGLRRLEQSGVQSPFHIQSLADAVLADSSWVQGIGDIGLLLWLCGEAAPDRFEELSARWTLRDCLEQFRDARHVETTALALFLAGLSCVGLARPETLTETMRTASGAYQKLRRNQGDEGLFGRCSTSASLLGKICGEIGSFGDQAHAIYALAKYAEAYGDHRAMHKALDCALALCERQGSLGQWWSRYDSSSGQIAARFPILSAQQCGIGPMALLAIGEAAHCDFTPWIYKGLQWIEDNELGIQMADHSASAIWTGVNRSRPRRIWNSLANLTSGREDQESRFGLRQTFECYAHELGWFLYAFANWDEDKPSHLT